MRRTVELAGNFVAKPIPATRNGAVWTVELPMTAGRYIWLWRVNGKTPTDEAVIAAAKSGESGAPGATVIAGVRTVQPLQRLPDADAR